MRLKKVIFSFLLIGLLFNTFHDYVFYNVDPCMKYAETAFQLDDGYCEIHENFHMPYIEPFVIIPINNKFEEKYTFYYKKPDLDPLALDIFKPPKKLS
ncbi:hypothetical protein [Persephonella sp.]